MITIRNQRYLFSYIRNSIHRHYYTTILLYYLLFSTVILR